MTIQMQGGKSGLQIPVVNISNPDAITAARLADAVMDCGFVFVNGEGLCLTSGILDHIFALVRSKQAPLHGCVS